MDEGAETQAATEQTRTPGHFGELVQLDASFHEWCQGRGPRVCLMNMVDHATSTVEACLGYEETIWAAAGVLRQSIENYVVPLALYTD